MKILCLTLSVGLNGLFFSQSKTPSVTNTTKLVVGIVVDQMRNDYIYRYWERFGNDGFKRLVNNGYYFRNAHYNYIPTYTGPGHASIYTGTTPRQHGIIANDWFVKENFSWTGCVSDTSVRSVGTPGKGGMASPAKELASTVGDELKITTNGRAKVYGVALKDRAAILPAGHAANGAFWYDDATGNFVTSTWYMQDLPQWLKDLNEKQLPKLYLQKGWQTLYPVETYSTSIQDDNRFEGSPFQEKPAFPYEFSKYIEKNSFGILKVTPHGNSITRDAALACIKGEQLGKDDVADLFCISFSSTDAVSHTFGTRAIEVEDVYLRLDRDIAEILNVLDKEVGKNNYTVFLTADHGGADVPLHLKDNKIPAGNISEKKLTRQVKDFFRENYGDTLLLANLSNEQIFINEAKLYGMNLNKEEVEQRLCRFLTGVPGIAEAYPASVIKNGSFSHRDMRALLQNGYNHRMSGNVCFIFSPGWIEYGEKGTTHGTGYSYDTHIPVIFYGNGVKKGESLEYVSVTQIAPTVCEMLKISQPNACISEPLSEIIK